MKNFIIIPFLKNTMICIYDDTIFYNNSFEITNKEVVKCNMWDKIFLESETTSSNLKYEKKKKKAWLGRCREAEGKIPSRERPIEACREATLVHRRVQGG